MTHRPNQPQRFETGPLRGKADLGDGVFILDFDWFGPAPHPGQFYMLRPVRTAVLLGRPISVFAWSPPSRPATAGRLRFLVARRGRGTTDLLDLQPGEAVELNGPIGGAWPSFSEMPPAEADQETAKKSAAHDDGPGHPPRLALIGGGIGIAPLVFLANTLPAAAYDFYAGFRSKPYGLDQLSARKLTIATEDGSAGHQGRIPDFIDPAEYGAVCVCGPEIMLRIVAGACARAGVSCWLSLERRMACGAGACLGCTVHTATGNRRCCVDGPVFKAEELEFDD